MTTTPDLGAQLAIEIGKPESSIAQKAMTPKALEVQQRVMAVRQEFPVAFALNPLDANDPTLELRGLAKIYEDPKAIAKSLTGPDQKKVPADLIKDYIEEKRRSGMSLYEAASALLVHGIEPGTFFDPDTNAAFVEAQTVIEKSQDAQADQADITAIAQKHSAGLPVRSDLTRQQDVQEALRSYVDDKRASMSLANSGRSGLESVQ